MADEEMAPSFAHTAPAALPQLELGGAAVRVLVGSAFGATSPVVVRSPTLYLDIVMQPGDAFPLPDAMNAAERALYVVDGAVELDGVAVPPFTMVLLEADDEPLLSASARSRAVLIGGEPLGHRHIWWNFVSSHKARTMKAADDWAAGRFGTVPGETEFITLPERRP